MRMNYLPVPALIHPFMHKRLCCCSFLLLLAISKALHAQEVKPSLELKVEADYLALHLNGKAPSGTTSVQYRLAESGGIATDTEWQSSKSPLGVDGSFTMDLALSLSRWSEVQVRAMRGDEVLVMKTSRHRSDVFTLLTNERLAALPEGERVVWQAYLKKSNERSEREFDIMAAECRKLGMAQSKPAVDNRAELELDSDTPESYFASDETWKLAEAVISYQTPTGGWSKSVDYKFGPRQPGMHWTSQKGDPWHYCGTIDNRTTTEQIKLLAGVYSATKNEAIKSAVMRGLEYLFEAQYPNGGWPQNYPVESGYHEAITLNDNAMIHVLEVLLMIAEKKAMFAFADDDLSARARKVFEKGLACLSAAQVKVNGKLTVWCAQHDPLNFEPFHARAKEPPSLSGAESAEVIRFFMRKAPLTPQAKAMIEPALEWFEAYRITGLRKTKNAEGKTDYVSDSTSKEVYWARFYDVQTGKPMFAGAQDGIVYATFRDMAAKNKVAYDFFTTKPAELLSKEVVRWKKRMGKGK